MHTLHNGRSTYEPQLLKANQRLLLYRYLALHLGNTERSTYLLDYQVQFDSCHDVKVDIKYVDDHTM